MKLRHPNRHRLLVPLSSHCQSADAVFQGSINTFFEWESHLKLFIFTCSDMADIILIDMKEGLTWRAWATNMETFVCVTLSPWPTSVISRTPTPNGAARSRMPVGYVNKKYVSNQKKDISIMRWLCFRHYSGNLIYRFRNISWTRGITGIT